MPTPTRTGTFVAAAVVLDVIVAAFVWKGISSGWLAIGWLLVVAFLVAGVATGEPFRRLLQSAVARPWIAGLALLVVLLPLAPRIATLSLTLSHPDEFSLAWFTHEFSLSRSSIFGPVPERPIWDHQMASLFFVLQKLYFKVAGEAPEQIKLSTMPYFVVVGAALLFFAKRLLGLAAALAAVVIYAFLAPSVYADTFATPVTTSMAFFAVFFAVSIVNVRRQDFRSALLAGAACAFCYLGIPTSYLALPLLFVFAGLSLACLPFRRVVRGLAASLAAFVIVLLPFGFGASRSGNFFSERVVRVAPVVAPLFGLTPPKEEVDRSRSDLGAKWKMQLLYLVKDDAGGCCGFGFGQVALLDPVTAVLLVAGLVSALLMRRIRLEMLMAASVVATSLFGLGFANPPPMVTRFALLFPFFALFLACPIALILEEKRLPRIARWAVSIALLAVLVGVNVRHLREGIARDTSGGREDYEDVKVARFLQRTFPNRPVKVAAFGGFHLGYTLGFFLPGVDVEVDYHQQLLDRFDTSRDYVYVILFPPEFDQKFQRADPTGVLITTVSRKYSIFVSRGLARGAGLVSVLAPREPRFGRSTTGASATGAG